MSFVSAPASLVPSRPSFFFSTGLVMVSPSVCCFVFLSLLFLEAGSKIS